MNVEDVRTYCLSKKAVEESFPFDEDTLVFKVAGKMFALMSLKKGDSVNLKCDPERAIELRESYEGIYPGYHMSKIHWNTVKMLSDVPDNLFYELIDHSYDLVVEKLPKKIQKSII